MSEQRKVVSQTKTWAEPQLTILVRNNQEEEVLSTCKLSAGGSGWMVHENGCFAQLQSTSCGAGCALLTIS